MPLSMQYWHFSMVRRASTASSSTPIVTNMNQSQLLSPDSRYRSFMFLARKHGIMLTLGAPKELPEDDDHDVTTTDKNNSSSSACASSDNVLKKQSISRDQSLVSMWTKLGEESKRYKDLSMAIAKYIALDLRPLNSVNDQGFVQLIKILEPRYNIDSRTHITRKVLPKLYEDLKAKVRSELTESGLELISLTTDGWTSCSTKSFITVTAHIISHDWKAKSYVLNRDEFEGSHTGENLAKELERVLAEWGISKDKVAVTTDNAANICLGMRICGVTHVKCMAHTLNLSTQKCLAISGLSKVCNKVRKIVSYFHRSTSAASLLRKTLAQLELPVLKPIIDVVTRWNSTLEMLERYMQLRPAISAVLSNQLARNQQDNVADEDIAIIEAVIAVLQVMKTSTTLLSSEQQPTASLILPLKASLIKNYSEVNAETCQMPVVNECRMTIVCDLEERYDDDESIEFLQECSAMDPRFKNLSWLNHEEKTAVFDRIIAKAVERASTLLRDNDSADAVACSSALCPDATSSDAT